MKSKIGVAFAAFLATAFLLVGSGARAAVVTFTLENVVFDDGTAATGTFTFNTTTHAATPDITTVNGAIVGATYTMPITAALAADTSFVFTSGGNELVLEAPNPLSETSASSILGGDESGPLVLCPGTPCNFFRDINLSDNPTINPTPLPAALPLFATGIGGLGLLGWRRKRKAQA